MPASDPDLVRSALDGDERSFEELVRRYERLVLNIVYHFMGRSDQVEDMAQEIFLRLYDNLAKYDGRKPLSAWLGRIAANRCIDELRRRRRQKIHLESDLVGDDFDQGNNVLARVQAGDLLTEADSERAMRMLHKAMDALPESERTAFLLRELEGLDYDEVAAICATSEPAARIRVSRARKKLQEQLEEWLHGK